MNLWNILSGVPVLGSCLEMDVMMLKLFHVPPDPRAGRGGRAEGLVGNALFPAPVSRACDICSSVLWNTQS